MVEAFQKRMAELGCTPEKKYLVGLSGGSDSMALANLLLRFSFDFVAVHLNHSLRDEESEDDAQFVKEWCELQKVPLILEESPLDNAKNIQIQARLARYDLFAKVATEKKIDFILTAHHRDDQIETIYMNILRGSGFKGLRGIPVQRGNILRPLLNFRKAELLDFMRSNGFHWREDSSNAKLDYTRNKVRHVALPRLRELVSDLDDRLLELSECASEMEINLERFLPILFDRAVKQEGDLQFIELRAFEEWNQLADMLLLELLRFMGFIWTDPTPIRELSSGKMWSDGEQNLYAHRSSLILEKQKPVDVEFSIDQDISGLLEPVELGFENWPSSEFKMEIDSGTQAAFDASKLKFPLRLRRWRKGDRFRPLGMNGDKKLSDHFVDLKMPIPVKNRQWVLCSEDQPIWIVGGRMDGRFRVVDATENIYLVTLLQIENSSLEN